MSLKNIFLLASLVILFCSPTKVQAAQQQEVTLSKIWDNGADGKRKIVLVVGEGYSEADKAKYYADVESRVLQGALAHDAYKANQKGFNIYRLDAWSKDSGCSHVKGQTKKTFFGVQVNDLGLMDIGTVLGGGEMKDYFNLPADFFDVLARAEALVGHCDVVIMLLNDPTDNGVTYYRHFVIAGQGFDWRVMCHELGHALGNLWDEYAYANHPYKGPARNFLNSSTLKDRVQIAWASHLALETKVPTPIPLFANKSPTANGIGVFEGGATCDKGIYRPGFKCRMNDHTSDSFCLVCADWIGASLNQWLPNPKPLPYQNELPKGFDINGIKGYTNFGFSLHKNDLMYDYGLGKLKSLKGPYVQNCKFPIGNYLVESYQKDGKDRSTQFIVNPFEVHNGFGKSKKSAEYSKEMKQGWTFFNLPYASKEEAIAKGLGIRIYKIKPRDLSEKTGAERVGFGVPVGTSLFNTAPVKAPVKAPVVSAVKVEKTSVKHVLTGTSPEFLSYPMLIAPDRLDALNANKRLELIVDMKPESLAQALKNFKEVKLQPVKQ